MYQMILYLEFAFIQLRSKVLRMKTSFKMAFFLYENASALTKNLGQNPQAFCSSNARDLQNGLSMLR